MIRNPNFPAIQYDYPVQPLHQHLVKPGQALVGFDRTCGDNRLQEVLNFVAEHSDRVHFIMVRMGTTAMMLQKLLNTPERRVIFASHQEARERGFKSAVHYLMSAEEDPSIRIVLAQAGVMGNGWMTHRGDAAISCTYDVSDPSHLVQLFWRLKDDNAPRLGYVRYNPGKLLADYAAAGKQMPTNIMRRTLLQQQQRSNNGTSTT